MKKLPAVLGTSRKWLGHEGLRWRSFIHVSTLAQEGVALQRGRTAPSLGTPLIAQLLAALQVL